MPFSGNPRSGLVLVACVACAYAACWGLEYSADLLGRSPVLDARENLGWVEWIRAGTVPAEPMYRALLYPWLLSVLPFAAAVLPSAAIVLGLGCHLLNACLVGRLAGLMWQSVCASWLSALLYAVYPVALYFAVQVLDVTLATSCFLAALLCLLRPTERVVPWRLLAGFFIACAVLARPNFLLVALAMPLVGLLHSRAKGQSSWAAAVAIVLPLALLFLAQGVINTKLGGEFRLLPWQGSYNLYAANKTGANGKYFAQQLAFEDLPAGVNPTRVESELLYRQAVGADAVLAIDAMSSFWKRQLLFDISGDPLRWVGLMGRKLVYLINDWEQYNNLSYTYQKARFSALRFNPLGWGLLLLLAGFALMSAWTHCDRKTLIAIGAIGLVYAVGVLLFFVSARFRIPLAPLLCTVAGGLVLARPALQPKRVVAMTAPLLLLALAAYGNWFDARDKSTYIQDQALLAIAASLQAEDLKALDYAGMVLEQQPQRQDMRRIEVTCFFNLWLEASELTAKARYAEQLNAALAGLKEQDAATYFIAGVSAWLAANETDAVERWTEGLAEYGTQASTCAAALLAVGKDAPRQAPELVQQIRVLLIRE